LFLPLLALIVLGASAAAPPSPEAAVQSARAAIDNGDTARAETLIDDALRAFGTRDVEAAYTLRVMRVEVELVKGQREAVSQIETPFPAKYRHTEAAVRRLIYIGFAREQEEPLSQAEAIAKRYQPQLMAEVYRGRAVAFRKENDAREAIRYAALNQQRELQAKANATLAFILGSQQRYSDAVDAGERALVLARLPNVVQNSQGNLGWSYIELGDYETAEELFTSAEATARQIGNTKDQVAWLIQLGNLRFRKRDYKSADRFNALAIAAGAGGRELGYAWANRARSAIELARYDDARAFNAKARTAKKDANDGEALWSSDIIDARILMDKDRNYGAAEKLLVNALAQTKNHKLDAQTQLARLYVRAKPDKARAAFDRAVTIVRQQRGNIKDRNLRFAFLNTAEEMMDEYVDFLVAKGASNDALTVVEASRAESLEEGRTDSPRRVDPQMIARNNHAIVLDYWLGRRASYLWEITGTSTKLHRLETDSAIEDEAETYQRQIVRQGAELTQRGEELYKKLVGPAKIPKGARVIVIADGRLHTVNFETLVAPNPQRFWIHDVIVTHAASLQILGRGRRPDVQSPGLLLIGNATSPDPIMYPPLHNAAAEMRSVEKRFAVKKVLEGADATPAAYRAASPGKFEYVHFVGHAMPVRKRPLDSAVILASDGRSYKLLAGEIGAIPLHAQLVTISSCEGVGTRTYAAEGVVGLAWGFLRAGAEQVVASLWKVDDAASAKLMDAMYGEIQAGRDPAAALRNAKLVLLRTYSKKPRYWAPFVLYAGSSKVAAAQRKGKESP